MYISVLETMEKNTENERGRERDGERARMGIAFLIEA